MNAIVLLGLLPIVFVQTGSAQEAKPQETIAGSAVIFFGPTKEEGDSLVQLSGLDLADVFDDFDLAAGKSAVYAGRREIPVHFTTSPAVFVKLSTGKIRRFDRRMVPEHVGMILTDGFQEPRILAGITDERRLTVEINEFFNIK